jgi:hypothetical protein
MRVRVLRVLTVSVMLALVGPLAQPAGAITVGEGGGCTPGFWKNHTGAWQEHNPGTRLGVNTAATFTIPDEFAVLRTKTFLQALSFNGGPNLIDAAKLLLKHAVTAYLNAAHDDIQYPLQRYVDGGIQDQVNAALASLDRETMLELKNQLDALNNAECQASGDNTNSDN